MITPAQATLFDRLMRDGATVAEATLVVQLATHIEAIELAAWEHELRGKGGKWAKGGGGGGGGLIKVESFKVVPSTVPVTRPRPPSRSRAPKLPAPDIPPEVLNDKAAFAALTQMRTEMQTALVDMTAASERRIQGKAEAQAKYLLLQVQHAQEEHLQHKAHRKFAVEAGITIGGLLLAVLEGLIGAPGITQIVSAMAPPVVQAITEWRKKL